MDYELLLLSLSRNANSQAPYFRECIGQHMIAAYLAKYDFRAKVYSGDILDSEAFILHEVEEYGIRYVGFYVAADNMVMIGNLIQKLKKTTELILFVGGPQAAALGEAFLLQTGCDFIIVGEGERPVLQLLSYLEDGVGCLEDVKSIRYLKEDRTFASTPLDEPIMDLDLLPYPRKTDSFHKQFRMSSSIGLLTGRGCPFHCTFCYEGATSKVVRYRSIANVMGEIDEVLSYNPSLTTVNVFDDTFTLKTDRVYEFCHEMKLRGLHWTCEAHVSCIYQHPEMVAVMIDAGLVAMQIGIESGSQRVLDAYQKHITPDMITEVVRICHKAGLCTLEGNYIIGGAFESEETLSESLLHAKNLLKEGRGMIEIQTVFFAPYFDTPITKNPEQFGIRILPERMESVITTMREPVVETEELSVEEIRSWKQRFERELQDCYLEQTWLCTKQDVLRKEASGLKMGILASKWYDAYTKVPHLAEFLQHTTKTEQEYDLEKYPIRVGTACFKADKSVEIDQHIVLDGLEAEAWQKADGRVSARQIAEELQMPLETIERIYRKLNQRCLVYFSPF